MESHSPILINHIGYHCSNRKHAVVTDNRATYFEVENMALLDGEDLAGRERMKTILCKELVPSDTLYGNTKLGDFSEITTPGLYRVTLPELDQMSFQFVVSDGAFNTFPRMFLDFIHDWRSGDYENDWRGPLHLDDARRSDTGQQIDVTGGWYDAGDLRQWMGHSTLPALGFMDIKERLGWKWGRYSEEQVSGDDLVAESTWGLKFILKMQDPETGMFFEDVGGGGSNRMVSPDEWWFENHAGCAADNSDNRFTDNIPDSGDERVVRVQYNPIVQYTNITVLLRGQRHLEQYNEALAKQCRHAALRSWKFMKEQHQDDRFHDWTSVRSWRLIAFIELSREGLADKGDMEAALESLLELQSEKGMWFMDAARQDYYRGILHSAQPILALSYFAEQFPEHELAGRVREALTRCWEQYLEPVTRTNPFGIIPYGIYKEDFTRQDRYRKWKDDLKLRFFMPAHSDPPVNHGLAGHWTSWAHGLAWMGSVLQRKEIQEAAWDQLYWLWGRNPADTTFVTGAGYNNPMPYSRFLGTVNGGFCNGFRGTAEDEPFLDERRLPEWNSTEYWNTPLSNSLMALSHLLYSEVPAERKLGAPQREKVTGMSHKK